METKEKMLELLLQDTLKNVESGVRDKLDAVETSFEAKLDGMKLRLNEKINDITSIIEQRPLVVNFGTIETPKTELVHSSFNMVINALKSQKRNPKNIMMVGEAGSGKTHLASSVAKALGLKFYPMSVGLQTTKSDLLGFINAYGSYVTTPVREAFEKGGLLLLDEFDAAHAGVVTIINSLLANGHCSFPDGIIEKNDKFVCMVACNTYGHGANIDYVGRNRLDGATLDRFVIIPVGYDTELEKQLTSNNTWHSIIQKIRVNAKSQGIKMIISPRASMDGADLLDAGFKIEDVIDMVVMKGADDDTKLKLMRGIDLSGIEPVIREKEEIKYKRDLDKYQTFQIRTEYENFSVISITPMNKLIEGDGQEYIELRGKEYRIHAGSGWSHQYSDRDSIYFAANNIGATYNFSSRNKEVLEEFFNDLEGSGLETTMDRPLAFEFIRKGCRTPWTVITMERAE